MSKSAMMNIDNYRVCPMCILVSSFFCPKELALKSNKGEKFGISTLWKKLFTFFETNVFGNYVSILNIGYK